MSVPDPGDGAQDSVLTLIQQLFTVTASLEAEVSRVLAEFDLSGSAGGLLWLLDPARPRLRMREIARRLGCDPSNVSLLGDKLERAGLVCRRTDPDDRRSRAFVLTEAGTQLRGRLLARLVTVTPLPRLTDREQHQLSRLLTKLGTP